MRLRCWRAALPLGLLVLVVAGARAAEPRYRLVYATLLGGSYREQLREIVPYPDGSLLVSGQAMSSDMPITEGVVQPKYAGDDPAAGNAGVVGGDLYLVRLSPDGGRVVCATYFGGSRQERDTYGMALDREGNVIVTSMTRSPDLPTTPGAFQPKYGGGPSDWFAAKLSADLKRLLWCTYLGGSDDESPRGGLALDADDNVVLVGTTRSPNFPVTAGAYQTTLRGGADGAVAKLSADGGRLLWATFLGGSSGQNDGIMGAQLDTAGNVYLGGHTTSPDFPVTPGAPQSRLGGACDAFLAKLSPDGARLLYGTYLGGAGNEFAEHRLGLGADGTAYLTGVTQSADFPTTPGVIGPRTRGAGDGFVAALAPDGRRLVFSTLLGGSGQQEFFLWPTRDLDGNLIVVGQTGSSDFPVTPDAQQPRYGGGATDGVLAVLSPDATRLIYASFLGGNGDDLVRSVALGAKGELYLIGSTTSTDFQATPGALQRDLRGGSDAFVVKLERATAAP